MTWIELQNKLINSKYHYFHTDNGVLLCGDCLEVMEKIPDRSISLIYIDPPYGIPRDRLFGLKWKSAEEHYKFCDELGLSIIRNIDKKGKRSNYGIAHYLFWIYPRLILMKELLANDGSIYVHLDYHMVHYVRLIMDDVFRKENFRNEIVWSYRRWNVEARRFNSNHDIMLFYSKISNYTWNQLYEPKSEKSSAQGLAWKSVFDESGKRRSILTGEKTKGVPMRDVWEISIINPIAEERLDYSTQKPEKLLERIVLASSNKGDVVADFFCGSGTTAAVAEKLGRKWIVCDVDKKACEIAKKRIQGIQ